MSSVTQTYGANTAFIEELYERYRANPQSVSTSWQEFFHDYEPRFEEEFEEDAEVQLAAAGGTQSVAAPPPQPAVPQPAPAPAPHPTPVPSDHTTVFLRGAAGKIAQNMETSLTIPTATSIRNIPVKVLEENRRVINNHLTLTGQPKASFTHIIAWALVTAIKQFPRMNAAFIQGDTTPARIDREDVNLGIAIDVERKDGSRSLLVPNVKRSQTMDFAQFLKAYNEVVRKARNSTLEISDFEGTTISLTNPGTIGTIASVPRLMQSQGTIIATGQIDYPAEYSAADPSVLADLGISKVMTMTSTYDHRIIQGAESGAFLARVHELLLGADGFYDQIFDDLRIAIPPMRWSMDKNPEILGGDHTREQTIKQARVLELITAYRVRGHLIADIDPLHAMPLHHHPELDIETYGLTIWDLDRVFITGGLAGKESTTLRDILDILQRAYCGKVGIEYRHIQSKEQKLWIREEIRKQFVYPEPLAPEIKKQLLAKLTAAEQFERFLHTKYLGQKRFSLEG